MDFVSQGRTPEEVKKNLFEVIEIQFEEMQKLGTLKSYTPYFAMRTAGMSREKYFELLKKV